MRDTFDDFIEGAGETPSPPTLKPKPIKRRKTDLSLFEKMGALVGAELNKVKVRIVELESRTKESRFIGAWTEGVIAKPGNSVAYQGSTWTCIEQTATKPGTENSGWVLSAKRGRDGKDFAR